VQPPSIVVTSSYEYRRKTLTQKCDDDDGGDSGGGNVCWWDFGGGGEGVRAGVTRPKVELRPPRPRTSGWDTGRVAAVPLRRPPALGRDAGDAVGVVGRAPLK